MRKASSKLAVLLLALVLGTMMVFTLTACGGGSDNKATNNEEAGPVEETAAALGPHTVDMTSDEMWASYKEFSEGTNLSDITLKALEEHFGVEAEQQDSDSTTNDSYMWHSNDEGGLLLLLGKETGKFVSASQAYPK